jgi:hypothetical protein
MSVRPMSGEEPTGSTSRKTQGASSLAEEFSDHFSRVTCALSHSQ